jgi:NADH:ubiquinone reductase (H+-translocating)
MGQRGYPPAAAMPAHQRRRVLILGGGHAGFRTARRLLDCGKSSDDLEIVVVSAESSEVYHGLMPQIVGGKIQARNILVPLRQYLAGVIFYHYTVERIDLANRRVYLDPVDERAKIEIGYDYLVIALGSVTDLSRFPGLQEHGLQTKTIGDVYHLHDHLLETLERASVEDDPVERKRLLNFIVVGAGYAGIEFGAETNNLLHEVLRFYPSIRSNELDISILCNTERILPAMHPSLADRASRYLARRGVRIRFNTSLKSASVGEAVLSTGERVQTRTIIAATGISPNPVVGTLPVKLEHGRILTDEYCGVPEFPGVFAVGDDAAIRHPGTGKPCPPTFLYAITQGKRVADNILADIRGKPPQPYEFSSFGEVAQLGHTFGLLQCWGVPFSGLIPSFIVRTVFLFLLPSWRCRLGLLSDWFISVVFPTDISQLKISRSATIIPLRFAAGQEIVRQGQPGSRFYIVQSGRVEVVRKTGEREEVVAILGPGKYFGEVALLQDSVRTATVRALDDTAVLSIARKDFMVLVEHLPVLERSLMESTRTALAKAGEESAS